MFLGNTRGRNFSRRQDIMTYLVLAGAAIFLVAWCYLLYVGADSGTVGGGSFGSDNRVLNAARGMGLRNPHVVGDLPLYECGAGDAWFSSARVQGTNINGDAVTAIVCCGPLEGFSKGCTVRF